MREERWKRLSLEQNEADEGDQSDAKVPGVCHRSGCAVPDTDCAKTLIGQSAPKGHVKVSGREPRWHSNVRPVKFRGVDDSTQHSQGAVELEWDLGDKMTRCGTRGRSRRNWTDAGRVHHWSDQCVNGSGTRGAVSPLVWKSHKLKQGGTSTLAGEAKDLSPRLGHLEWIMRTFTTVLFPAVSLENKDTYIQRFSAVSVIDCKSVFDSVTNPGA